MGSSRYTFMDTLIIDAIWKKAMGICPEMRGGHCLREELLHSKNIEAIAKQIAIKLL
jgi:hypothetical protein